MLPSPTLLATLTLPPHFSQLADEGKSQAAPSAQALGRSVHLREAVEYALAVFLCYAHARVGHLEDDALARRVVAHGHFDAPARRRELHGVARKVLHDAAQLLGIGGKERHALVDCVLHTQPFLLRKRLDGRLQQADHVPHIHQS